MLHQKRSGSLARLKYLMAVPLCAALLCASTLAFSKTYGWIDLAPKKAVIHDTIPPPPPAPPVKHANVRHPAPPPPPAPPVKNPKVIHETPPPPPAASGETQVIFPEPKNPSMVTSKGYKYAEASYKINGKTDYKVIIVEKDGTKKEWFKNSASAADITLLKEKYGFTFMSIRQYEKMLPPPPPPAAPKSVIVKDVKVLSPRVVPDGQTAPKSVKVVHFPPPVIVKDGRVAPKSVKVVRFPPPVVVPDGQTAPKSIKVVRFPPPVVVPDSPNTAKHVPLKMVRLLPPQKPLTTIRLMQSTPVVITKDTSATKK